MTGKMTPKWLLRSARGSALVSHCGWKRPGLPSDKKRLAADPMHRPGWPNALQTCCKTSSFMTLMLMPSQSASKIASKRVYNWSWIIGSVFLAVLSVYLFWWPKELLLVHETTKRYSVYHQKQHHRMNRIFLETHTQETIRRLLKTNIK